MSVKRSPKYTAEFKQTIVNLYHAGKSYAEIKKEYGISHSALANWQCDGISYDPVAAGSHCFVLTVS
ncbi:MAG: transposase [Clostridia bacterium]|nr:transposase [Clostridia bacterium]